MRLAMTSGQLALSRRVFGSGLLAACGMAGCTPMTPPAAQAAPFAPNLQSLAWWMRRPTGKKLPELIPYYEQIIGMPLVRAFGSDLVLLWAGEDQIFEVKTDNNPVRKQADPETAACIPVFRVHDLALWRARMATHGYAPVSQRRSQWGETLFYRGPDNLITGFEYRAENSPLPSDRKALKQWRQGPARLADLPALPDSLHYMSRAIRHVADVPAMSRWYRDKFGLQPLGAEGESQLFALGDDSIFEVAPGGVAIPEPGDRTELPDTYVLRVHDLDGAMAALQKRGAKLKGEVIVQEETTRLRFVPDPEGWITGIEERGLIRDRYLEDVEADRRWRALGPGAILP